MASSGTVGTTTLDLAKVIEKTYRRCGIPAGGITPELIDIAKENLFLLFNNFSNRGLNLWCVDRPMLGLKSGKSTYSLPSGTIDIINMSYRTFTPAVLPTPTTAATTVDWDFTVGQKLVGFGVSPTAGKSQISFTLSHSDDGVVYTTAKSVVLTDLAAGEHYWYTLPVAVTSRYWRFSISTVHTTDDLAFTLVSGYSDLVVSRMNRDDYESLPNKTFEGTPSVNYMIDRQMVPTFTLWPVPSTETNCIHLVTHRQIQDVGNDLTATIEVPDRWLDAFLWGLAAMCAVEVPEVPEKRIALCQQQSVQSMVNAESEERDSAPIFIAPNISVYTR